MEIELDYRSAGVDIDAGNHLVDRIKSVAAQTKRPGVMAGLGGFGALFELPTGKYKEPVLVSATDGVGTKLRLALELQQYDDIGIDLVAMCANDLIVQGAEPLFFLDYYATGKLDVDVAEAVIRGIGKGCEQAQAALVGGETAEMPGMYQSDDFDLAGFCVGVVEKQNIIDGSQVKAGDALIGIASSGVHSNGYSLIRKVIEVTGADLDMPFGRKTLGEVLLAPTRIYVQALRPLIEDKLIHAAAHITGGGLLENIPRVLPYGVHAVIDSKSWRRPIIFDWLQTEGGISQSEMFRTFNCGVGMVIIVEAAQANACIESLKSSGESAWVLGHLAQNDSEDTPSVIIQE